MSITAIKERIQTNAADFGFTYYHEEIDNEHACFNLADAKNELRRLLTSGMLPSRDFDVFPLTSDESKTAALKGVFESCFA